MSQAWLDFPVYFEEELKQTNNILDLLKRATRDKSEILKLIALNCLFRLLDNLAQDRNPIAATIYKKMTFSVIENHADIQLRSIILRNCINTYSTFSSIPTDILIEPLIK
jgi:hypothetical protein